MSGNPEWTGDPCLISNFYRRYRSKSTSTNTWRTNEVRAEQVDVENTASQLHNNNVRIINKWECINKERLKLVQIKREENKKIKTLWKGLHNDVTLTFRKIKNSAKLTWQCKAVHKRKIRTRRRCRFTSPEEQGLGYLNEDKTGKNWPWRTR